MIDWAWQVTALSSLAVSVPLGLAIRRLIERRERDR